MPISRFLVSIIRAYLISKPPLGRVIGKTPYLFVTGAGEPLSVKASDDIMRPIARHSGVTPLSWHRLRHTWAERMAEVLAEQANGMDKLMYLGGWTNPQSPKRYTPNAIAKQAREALRNYHRSLYREEWSPHGTRGSDLLQPMCSRDLPAVPMRVRSLDGQLVETGEGLLDHARPQRRRPCAITFEWELQRALDRPVLGYTRAEHLVRLYLADRLTRKKASTIHNDFATFLYFEGWLRTGAGVHVGWSDLTKRGSGKKLSGARPKSHGGKGQSFFSSSHLL